MIAERFFRAADRVLRGREYLGEALNAELAQDPGEGSLLPS